MKPPKPDPPNEDCPKPVAGLPKDELLLGPAPKGVAFGEPELIEVSGTCPKVLFGVVLFIVPNPIGFGDAFTVLLELLLKPLKGLSEDPNGFVLFEVEEKIDFWEAAGNFCPSFEKESDSILGTVSTGIIFGSEPTLVVLILCSLADCKFVPSLRMSCLDQIFQEISCPLLVNTIILGNGPLSSMPLQGSLTFTVEFKSRTIPKGVSSSSLSSGIGIVALS